MNLYNNISNNKRRTAILLGVFLLLVILLGWIFARVYDMPLILYAAVAISIIQALIGYYSGDKVALAISGARKIEKRDNPELWRTVENLCITAGLPMPQVYIISDPAPNAFATGRDPKHASLAVTTGLLELLDKSELQGVVAHELSHIGNYDIRLMTVVVVLVGIIALLSDIFVRIRFFGFGDDDNRQGNGLLMLIGIIAALLAPLIATMVQLAISRRREFLADSSGAMLTRYPEGLASALRKIGAYGRPMRRVSSATSHLFISNPLGNAKVSLSNLFSTHPPLAARISALTGMIIKD